MANIRKYRKIDLDPNFIKWFDDRFPEVALSHPVNRLLQTLQEVAERNPGWSMQDILNHFDS